MGFYGKLSKSVSLSLSGKGYREQNNYADLIGLTGSSASLTGTSLALSSSIDNSFSPLRLSLNLEGGLYETSFYKSQYDFHSKGNITLYYKWISLSANIQQGYFSVIDMVNAERNQKQNYQSYYIRPTINKNFLKNRLNSSISIGINGNNIYGNASMFMANLSYQLTKTTKTFGSFNRTQFSNNSYQLNDISVGISQELPAQRILSSIKTKI